MSQSQNWVELIGKHLKHIYAKLDDIDKSLSRINNEISHMNNEIKNVEISVSANGFLLISAKSLYLSNTEAD